MWVHEYYASACSSSLAHELFINMYVTVVSHRYYYIDNVFIIVVEAIIIVVVVVVVILLPWLIELQSFKDRRVIAFKKNLVSSVYTLCIASCSNIIMMFWCDEIFFFHQTELAELEIKHAKVSMLRLYIVDITAKCLNGVGRGLA